MVTLSPDIESTANVIDMVMLFGRSMTPLLSALAHLEFTWSQLRIPDTTLGQVGVAKYNVDRATINRVRLDFGRMPICMVPFARITMYHHDLGNELKITFPFERRFR